MKTMTREPDFVLNYLVEVEEKAEEILADKQQIIDLDRRRNVNREALRAIKKREDAPTNSRMKTWLNFGGMFIKMDTSSAQDMLNSDQSELDSEIENIRTKLHSKVDKLRDAEGKSNLKGFDLKSLSREETMGLKSSKLL